MFSGGRASETVTPRCSVAVDVACVCVPRAVVLFADKCKRLPALSQRGSPASACTYQLGERPWLSPGSRSASVRFSVQELPVSVSPACAGFGFSTFAYFVLQCGAEHL